MPTKNGYTKLSFIVSTDTQKADPETRKLIRSHVMQGKNRVKSSKKTKKLAHVDGHQKATFTNTDLFFASSIPKLLCSKFAAISFAADVEPSLVQDVLLFGSMSSETMFLLNKCIEPATSDSSQIWFAPMLSDAAYLYAACFTIQTFFDGLLARMPSAEAMQRNRTHYAKAIRMLQERLAVDDDSVRLSDSTIMTVLTLSGHAYTIGDYESADHHIDGLLKLVSMRGADTFFHNIRVYIEIIRSDLGMAMDRGTKPVLFTASNILWPLKPVGTIIAGPGKIISDHMPDVAGEMSDRLDCGLFDIWMATSEFCSIVNAISAGRTPQMSEETFLHYMGSIMYRLLHQRFETSSFDEAIRLGLVAFLSPIFLNWNRVELPDDRFIQTYKDALAGLILEGLEIQPSQRLWLFMIGALSMCHQPDNFAWLEPWLQTGMSSCCINCWDDMKDLLSSFLWVGVVYDEQGREITNSILTGREICVQVSNCEQIRSQR